MKKNKLNDYYLTGSIHTLAIKSQDIIENVLPEVSDCIKSSYQLKNDDMTSTIINPNKMNGDILSYSQFQSVMNMIVEQSGVNDYEVVRVDFRLDSYDENHYKDYAKLHKYIIAALAVTYSVRNSYRTTNLFNQKQLSIAIKNRYFEAESYDKAYESNYTDMAQSRLELRSKNGIDGDLKQQFIKDWDRRLDKSINNLLAVQQRYNDELIRIYKEDKEAFPRKFTSVKEFLMQYQDCIFSKEQLINLLSELEGVCKNPKTYAENYKKRYGIEYISQRDVLIAVKEIKRAMNQFFNN